MTRRRMGLFGLLAACLTATGSVAPAASAPSQQGPGQTPPRPRVHVTAAISGDAFSLSYAISSAGAFTPPGSEALEELVNSGLTTVSNQGTQVPRLAEATPSVENGLWSVFSDGRMETTWRIRDGAAWHDGTPVTPEDLVFTAQVVADREVGVFRNRAFDQIEEARVSGARTVVVAWKRPYIDADRLFSPVLAMPQPKHLLEQAYGTNKAGYSELPYWTDEYVGAGPFKLSSWVRGSHLVVIAHDRYVLGRPKIDELEVRFITDVRALAVNVLAGAVDVMLGRGLSLELALSAGDQWSAGHIESAPYTWIQLWPQLLNPTPAVVTDPQFRRALTYATDRQLFVDTFMNGRTAIAHSYLRPNEPGFAEIDPVVAKYEYDPRKARQIIQELGYSQGADGFFTDPGGRRLSVQVKANAGDDLREKLQLAIANEWQNAGVEVEAFLVPTQRLSDFEFISTFPGLWLTQRPNGLARLDNLHSTQAPLPENGFTGANISRYVDPDFDGLIDRFYVTISRPARIEIAKDIIHQMTDQVLIMGLFYTVEPILVNNRVQKVGPRAPDGTHAWNAHEWDVSS